MSDKVSEGSDLKLNNFIVSDNIPMSNKEFGTILEQLIKARKISVRQFAKEIGQKPSSVNEWTGKNARFPTSPAILKDIANYFSISVHELLYGEPDKNTFPISELLQKTEIHTGLYEITIKKVDQKK